MPCIPIYSLLRLLQYASFTLLRRPGRSADSSQPHKNMPDFSKMHEEWEAKQRELRENSRKPATKPVAFSLSTPV